MKKPFFYLLTAGLAFSMIANTGVVEAVGTDSSNATVEFTAPTDTVDPVDPENPENPNTEITPDSGNNTEQVGPLSLDYISNVDFGSHDISTSAITHATTTIEPYIQVTDRRGTGEGWNVQAIANSFTSAGENTLPGSTISFLNGGTISTSTTPAPVLNTNIVLSTGGDAVNIVTAAAREVDGPISSAQGLGTWVSSWLTSYAPDSEVSIYIPEAASSPGAHTSVIDWTLTSGPEAPTP